KHDRFRERNKSIRRPESRRTPACPARIADTERADWPRSGKRRSAAGSRGGTLQRLHGDLRGRKGPAPRPARGSALGDRDRGDGAVDVAGKVTGDSTRLDWLLRRGHSTAVPQSYG